MDYQVELLAPGTLCLRGEGQGAPSGYGTSGGKAGAPARVSFRPDGKAEGALPAYGMMEVGPGILRVLSAGSGGWGDPAGRDPSKVLQDIRDGILSPEKARADYGIEVDDGARGEISEAYRG